MSLGKEKLREINEAQKQRAVELGLRDDTAYQSLNSNNQQLVDERRNPATSKKPNS